MNEKATPITSACNFMSVKPIMADLPYPPVQVREKNRDYAEILCIDYCGAVSEMSAIVQYIQNENRLSGEQCSAAKTILGIAMAEMIHLQKLGELIRLLGGSVDFTAKQAGGRRQMWTPGYLSFPENTGKILMAGIEAEKAAINQYRLHIKMINDDCVNAVLKRIITDEEYHIMLLQTMIREL